VKLTVLCPSTSLTTFGGWPAAVSIVAVPCRRSWNLAGGAYSHDNPGHDQENVEQLGHGSGDGRDGQIRGTS